MPVTRRFAKLRHAEFEELTQLQRDWLLRGTDWFGDTDLARDIEASRAAWEMHRDVLLPQFISDNPGHRPFAWWVFDHGKERPIRPGQGFTDEFFADERRHHFGFLHSDIWSCPGFLQEPQVAYLRRNGLLTPEELALCPASDDEIF